MMLCEYLSNCIKQYLKNVRHIYEDKTWNSESITKANGLYNSMINNKFSMSLIVCNN